MTRNDKLVSKSVRLPADLVSMVEQAEGRDFSKKLVRVLEEYRDGDETRKEIIEEYDALVESRRNQLQHYSDRIMQASRISAACAGLIEAGSAMVQEPGHEHLPRDANILSPKELRVLEIYRNLNEEAKFYLRLFLECFV
ncbi:MAG: hypothetical protein K2O32_15215 [Acetatifactor sp.]|nr:hypothetical protein [Acetatifactor sp.]